MDEGINDHMNEVQCMRQFDVRVTSKMLQSLDFQPQNRDVFQLLMQNYFKFFIKTLKTHQMYQCKELLSLLHCRSHQQLTNCTHNFDFHQHRSKALKLAIWFFSNFCCWSMYIRSHLKIQFSHDLIKNNGSLPGFAKGMKYQSILLATSTMAGSVEVNNSLIR